MESGKQRRRRPGVRSYIKGKVTDRPPRMVFFFVDRSFQVRKENAAPCPRGLEELLKHTKNKNWTRRPGAIINLAGSTSLSPLHLGRQHSQWYFGNCSFTGSQDNCHGISGVMPHGFQRARMPARAGVSQVPEDSPSTVPPEVLRTEHSTRKE